MKTKTMDDDQIRIKIAEACGWASKRGVVHYDGAEFPYTVWIKDGKVHNSCPDYPHDLNACHEMVMQQPVSVRISINHKLCEMLREKDAYILDRCINAPARQRCEAFLRTLNLWEE